MWKSCSSLQLRKYNLPNDSLAGGDYFPAFPLWALSKETTNDEISAPYEKDSGLLQKKVSLLWMTALESVIDTPLSLILVTFRSMWLDSSHILTYSLIVVAVRRWNRDSEFSTKVFISCCLLIPVFICIQKSPYKHVSFFGRLRSYDRLKLRIEGKDYWQ